MWALKPRMTVCCASTIWKLLSLHASTFSAIPSQMTPRSVAKTTRPNANDTFTSTVPSAERSAVASAPGTLTVTAQRWNTAAPKLSSGRTQAR